MTSALTDHDVDLETQRDTKSKSRTPASHPSCSDYNVNIYSILLLDTYKHKYKTTILWATTIVLTTAIAQWVGLKNFEFSC
jgi:hypothetical protein